MYCGRIISSISSAAWSGPMPLYHPAVWVDFLVRIGPPERSSCCIDLAVDRGEQSRRLRQALAAVPGARTSAMAPAARPGILLPRLQRIPGYGQSKPDGHLHWLTGGTGILLSGGAIALVACSNIRSATAQSTAASTAAKGRPRRRPIPRKRPRPRPIPRKRDRSRSSGSENLVVCRVNGSRPRGSMHVQILDAAGKPQRELRPFSPVLGPTSRLQGESQLQDE